MTGRGRILGYVRVSSSDQNTARQLDGVHVDVMFKEKVSGKSMDRPELLALMKTAYIGDTVIIHSMDRLARNLMDLKKIVSALVANGASVQFVKESLIFTSKDDRYSQLMLNLMGSFAEFERSLIKSRQMEGIQIRKAGGGYPGRKPKITPEHRAEVKARVAAGDKKAAIAKDMSISREMVYKIIKE